jgi:AcrR family transcriptional regulator
VEILNRGELHKLSLREVARIAGVSQAAPYRHFENKNALLAAIAQEGFTILSDRIRTALAICGEDPEEQLYQISLAYLGLALHHANHFRLMFFSIPSFQPGKHPELERAAQGLFNELLSVVEQGQKHRVVRAGDPKQLALSAWSSFHGLTDLLVSKHLDFLSLHPEQAGSCMRDLMRTLFEGLKPASGSGA